MHNKSVSCYIFQIDLTFEHDVNGVEVKEQVLLIRLVNDTIIVEMLLTVNGTLQLETVFEILNNMTHGNITLYPEFVIEGKYDI